MKNCIYRFIDKDDNIIYIGKTKDLEKRLSAHNHLPEECYQNRAYIEYTTFDSEHEMDFAERYYIQKLTPKYNTILADKPIRFSSSELDEKKFEVHSINEYVIEHTKKEMEMLKIEIGEDRKLYIDLDVTIFDMLAFVSLQNSTQFKNLKKQNKKIYDILESKECKEKIDFFKNKIFEKLNERKDLLRTKYRFLNIIITMFNPDVFLKKYVNFIENTVSLALVVKEKYTDKKEVFEVIIRCK